MSGRAQASRVNSCTRSECSRQVNVRVAWRGVASSSGVQTSVMLGTVCFCSNVEMVDLLGCDEA